LSNIGKYFYLYQYYNNPKARFTTYQLNGESNIWWENTKISNVINKNETTWKHLKEIFEKKYLRERYIDNRAKEFHDLKLGSMNIDVTTTKFLRLLMYVPYLLGENEKENK